MKKLMTFLIVLLMPLVAWADYLGSWAINDYVTITANLHSASTGAETAADGDVDIWIYEDDSATQIYDDTMVAFDSITGLYLEKVQLLAATGFEAGKHYTVLIRATVGGIAGHTTHNFQILSQTDSVAISGDTTAADNMEDLWDETNIVANQKEIWVTDHATNYDGTLNMWSTEVEAISGDNTTDDDLEIICEGCFDLVNLGSNVHTVRNAAPLSEANTQEGKVLKDTTVATYTDLTSSGFTLTASSTVNDSYNNHYIVIEDAGTAGNVFVGVIKDYVGSTKTVTLWYDPGVFTVAATDKVYISVIKDPLAELVTNFSSTSSTTAWYLKEIKRMLGIL